MGTSFFSDLLNTIAERGRAVLSLPPHDGANGRQRDLADLARKLISGRGQASGVALADEILRGWEALDGPGRRDFLLELAREFGPDADTLQAAIAGWSTAPGLETAQALHTAAEPRRQQVLRRLNLAPRGTERLVRMREELFRHQRAHADLALLDDDFAHLFSSWFNPGFLVLRRIEWSTPANILEQIIRHEAVHAIRDWSDLRSRIEPADRRLFAFFHPQIAEEPLIFVEVALTDAMPEAIGPVLAEDRAVVAARDATTAVFYSISNCQPGLKSVSFGNFLIKQVVEALQRELPGLTTFVTLSPVPGFAAWLEAERRAVEPSVRPDDLARLDGLDQADWAEDSRARVAFLRAAATYLLTAKKPNGRPLDPVARFHLGNGARLERLNVMADRSEKGLDQSFGLMVNYLYDLDSIERNHEAYAERSEVVASSAVRRHLKGGSSRPTASPAPRAVEKAGG